MATLLLAAMAVIFIVCLIFPKAHPAVPWVMAFTEAAMVGGLADWFAVTALFRHPLGLPIPHTAIIPQQKDRLGDTLAQFLKENFLQPRVVARRLDDADLAGGLARWLAAPPAAGASGGPNRKKGIAPLIGQLVDGLDDPSIAKAVEDLARGRLQAMQLSPIIADAVDTLVAGGRHELLIDAAVEWGLATIVDEAPNIRGKVAERTNWLLRLAGADESLSDTMISSVQRLLVEIKHDPRHPVRQRLVEAFKQWTFDLRHFPESQDRVEGFKDDLLANPAMSSWVQGLWDAARSALASSLTDPGGNRLGGTLTALGTRIEDDAELKAGLNAALRRAVAGLAKTHGDEIVKLVSETVRGWDADTVTDKVEQAVGRDLQFIRINGTLIGGCIGLAIYGVARFALLPH
ncbi:DUF445 domain-containing protein [Sandarakinorhabdus sp.]|uniref:DUF445 domain-containing protein n=1 Tax=Sandarakinorhabdus sp. TaxID=1916663 RepID=UPI00286E6967|nr:DUF445 domain-containing protein [Sandarakinorhabdus sp.]